ncbi:hypothetical protein Ahy_B03g063580 [Arachis hypogaea]|uniref:Transposase MuDR plant domain-containing protein n=1 Tax=Arachis hypogaea TaxID=3818 RepID=A0A444ZY20_ARAHY|nr:hypothetical protein Ahy_B03g063580 [Arachis hypogaea]
MKGIANLRVYYNGEIIPNIHERFQIMSITDDACMQQIFCIYQQTRFHVPMIELYVEFEHMGLDAVGEEVKAMLRQKMVNLVSRVGDISIKRYIISRRIDYTVYELSHRHSMQNAKGCDWLIRASLIRKKDCSEIKRYNGKHMCNMGTISQDHAKLDTYTIADAIRSLDEAESIKVKSIIAEVQSRFNYIVSYRKAWLEKPKSVTKIFCD